jgi:hypothetical protein
LKYDRIYPEGTEYVYSNWTPRSCHYYPEAEKKANELRQQALTPAILEKMWIEKWDGKLPVYGQVPTIFKDISK